MKIFIIALAIFLTKTYGQEYDYHPVLSYGLVRHVNSEDGTQEFILTLDEDDQVAVVDRGCDSQRFRRCVRQYASDLGLQEIPRESLAFVQKLKQIVEEQGLDGLKKECKAGTNLKRCLGNQYEKCISEDYLRSIGVQVADAKVFITLSAQMAYQCTAGFDTLVNNWECIERVERDHRQEFKRCQSDYARKVQQDPSNICKYTQEMVNCMTSPFKQSCPPTVYGVICHSLQIGITTTLPQCSIICTKGSKDIKVKGEGRAETLSSFISRVLLENIPAHQFMAFRRRSWPIAGPACDDSKFKKCVNQFGKDVGLSNWPKRATALTSYLNQLIATRKSAGFEQTCKAAKNLGKCLGDQMESCFTAQHLEGMGIPPYDVLIYRELQAGLASECGPGYDIIDKNIDCMINCADQHKTEFLHCALDFETKVKRDPSHVCDHAQTFIRCNSGLLDQSCGSDVSGATCNAMRAEILVPLPTCKNLTCHSQEDISLTESSPSILAGHPITHLIDVLGDNLPANILRQQQAPSRPALDEDSSDSDSDSTEETTNDDGQDVQAKCDDKKLGQCAKEYAKQLGMKSFPADPAEFGKALQAIVAKYGKIGFKKICTSGKKFGQCLGMQQAKACLTVEHLVKLGLSRAQALGYVTILRTMGYECTKAYKVIMDNWDCMMNVTKQYNDTFVKCGEDFVKKVKQDPKNVCKYVQPLVNCDTKPFTEKCKRQVGQTVCQVYQVMFKQLLPKCQVKCKREDGEDDEILIPRNDERAIRADEADEDQVADIVAS